MNPSLEDAKKNNKTSGIHQLLIPADFDVKEAYCHKGHLGKNRTPCAICKDGGDHWYAGSQNVTISFGKEMGNAWYEGNMTRVGPVKAVEQKNLKE